MHANAYKIPVKNPGRFTTAFSPPARMPGGRRRCRPGSDLDTLNGHPIWGRAFCERGTSDGMDENMWGNKFLYAVFMGNLGLVLYKGWTNFSIF